MFVMPIKNVSEAEAEMNDFLWGHRVLAVNKEFVPDGENSLWSFYVEDLDRTAATNGRARIMDLQGQGRVGSLWE